MSHSSRRRIQKKPVAHESQQASFFRQNAFVRSLDVELTAADAVKHQLAVSFALERLCELTAESTLAIRHLLKDDFDHVELSMTYEEAMREAGRCLRCDHYGCGAMKGGRGE